MNMAKVRRIRKPNWHPVHRMAAEEAGLFRRTVAPNMLKGAPTSVKIMAGEAYGN